MTDFADQTGLLSVTDNFRLGNGKITLNGSSIGILANDVTVTWKKVKEPIMAKYPAVALKYEVIEESASIKFTCQEHSGLEITDFTSGGPFALIFTYLKTGSTTPTTGTVTIPRAVPGDNLTKPYRAAGLCIYEMEFNAQGPAPIITMT